MARYAGGGKNTVESCRSVDVLRWNKLGYLRSPRRFSWAWTRYGERVAYINVETQRHSVTLKYRSRSHDTYTQCVVRIFSIAAGRFEIERKVSWRLGDRVFGDEVISIIPMVPIILKQTQLRRSHE